ncbi:MAG TPA: LemA family protein [Planctomycetota bacterium]|nr:LemA family protein [Planctomycetota bacterium]
MLIGILVVLGLVVLLVLIVVAYYNKFIRMRNRVKESWAQIDVQLKRRYDLIPNLVETVKGYASHEKETFENVTKARAAAINAGTVKDQAQAENMLTGALKSLFAVAENYPELKANQNFMQLQEELTSTENKIGFARQHYNDVVRGYNTGIQMFPANVIAGAFGFAAEDYFELVEEAAREAPKVQF